MIVLDASLLIALMWSQDRHHEHAVSLFDELAGGPMVIHDLNLAEVLVGGVRAGRGEQMLHQIEAAGIQTADRPASEALRLATLRVETGLKLPDCCALDATLVHDGSLATFDARLRQAAVVKAVPLVPEQV